MNKTQPLEICTTLTDYKFPTFLRLKSYWRLMRVSLTSRIRLEAVSHILNIFDLEKGYKEERNKDRMIDIRKLVTGNTLLEVGCATGFILDYLATVPDKEFQDVVGVDLDDGRLWVGKKKYPYISFYKADAYNLPFPDKSFDTVLLPEILEHVSEPRRALDEAIRVAKEEVIITLPNASKENYDKSLVETPEHKWYPTKERTEELLAGTDYRLRFTHDFDFMIIKIEKLR